MEDLIRRRKLEHEGEKALFFFLHERGGNAHRQVNRDGRWWPCASRRAAGKWLRRRRSAGEGSPSDRPSLPSRREHLLPSLPLLSPPVRHHPSHRHQKNNKPSPTLFSARRRSKSHLSPATPLRPPAPPRQKPTFPVSAPTGGGFLTYHRKIGQEAAAAAWVSGRNKTSAEEKEKKERTPRCAFLNRQPAPTSVGAPVRPGKEERKASGRGRKGEKEEERRRCPVEWADNDLMEWWTECSAHTWCVFSPLRLFLGLLAFAFASKLNNQILLNYGK